MNCHKYEKLIMKHFDRLASDNEIIVLKKHLENCNQCKEQFEQLEGILVSLEQSLEPEIPIEFESNVMIKIRQYENINNNSQIKTNFFLLAMLGFIFSIPLALVINSFENINVYEILMGLLSKLSFILDFFLIVQTITKLMAKFILENNVPSNGLLYEGLTIIFILVFISISKFIHKVDNNLLKE